MLAPDMDRAARPSLEPAAAGGALIGVLLASVAVGAGLGWALGSVGYGVLLGAIAGIPLAVYSVYRRYRRVS
jgi:F0F1-type ATP synthase assembly protein I